MPMSIGDANDVQVVLGLLSGRSGWDDEGIRASVARLADRSYGVLSAGRRADELARRCPSAAVLAGLTNDPSAGTVGGPQQRWPVCTCGWMGEQRDGPHAREKAWAEAADHLDREHGTSR